jgi:hypothetical protein
MLIQLEDSLKHWDLVMQLQEWEETHKQLDWVMLTHLVETQ